MSPKSGDRDTTERRTLWWSDDLGIRNEPLIVSLLRYRQKKNRRQVDGTDEFANLISSKTNRGRQMPIIDLDYDFRLVQSSTPGHFHLFFDKPIAPWRWRILMLALWLSGVVEMGYAVWSLRRGANFVRIQGWEKKPGAETNKPEYGWFFKTKGEGK